jgi:hypothetical protein
MSLERTAAEREIERVLLDEWDPLGVRDGGGEEHPYAAYAHDIYGLLARGASDTQIVRHLHNLERDNLAHPELVGRDLSHVARALRRLETQL